jgi:hypothetical protein
MLGGSGVALVVVHTNVVVSQRSDGLFTHSIMPF